MKYDERACKFNNDTDDMVTKGIMLADGKVVDKGSYVPLKKVQEV